jgi:cytochrome c-type biogenesis protein
VTEAGLLAAASEAGGTAALLPAAASAFWLGLLTSVSPCPLAANIAAVSFVGRRVGSPRFVLLSGALYTAGRSFAYTVLGAALVWGLLAAPGLSRFLQLQMNRLLGPILMLAGLVLLGVGPSGASVGWVGDSVRRRVEAMGLAGAFLLGTVLAMGFCPTAAALFFLGLLPLAVRHDSPMFIPAVYGVGTGLPVLAFAALLSAGVGRVGRVFDAVTRIEVWVRRVTGLVFIAVGAWYVWTFLLGGAFHSGGG